MSSASVPAPPGARSLSVSAVRASHSAEPLPACSVFLYKDLSVEHQYFWKILNLLLVLLKSVISVRNVLSSSGGERGGRWPLFIFIIIYILDIGVRASSVIIVFFEWVSSVPSFPFRHVPFVSSRILLPGRPGGAVRHGLLFLNKILNLLYFYCMLIGCV